MQFENVKIETKGKQIIITVEDYTKVGALSASGKSKSIASTRGNVQVEGTDGVIVGLNVYKKVS